MPSAADEGICFYPHATQQLVFSVPRTSIASLVKDPESAICRRLQTKMWSLLASYVQSADPLSLRIPDLASRFRDPRAGPDRADGRRHPRRRGDPHRRRGLRAGTAAGHQGRHRPTFRQQMNCRSAHSRGAMACPALYPDKLFETEGATFTAICHGTAAGRSKTDVKRLALRRLHHHRSGGQRRLRRSVLFHALVSTPVRHDAFGRASAGET